MAMLPRLPLSWMLKPGLPLCRRHLRLQARLTRNLYSLTGIWDKEFSETTRIELENYWKGKLKDIDAKPNAKQDGEKYYALSMFPYPSGNLHMGHVRVYTISDAMARYHRLCGKNVLHPMGWDAFGLPAENAAIERGERPDKWTYSNISRMKIQLEDLCLSFNWDREYATCDPEYYRWTQYIFLKLHEAGLVYRKEAPVNWDPVDQTVLADEQIDEQGRSWRSGAKVEKRMLYQWYIKTTAYSKSLYDGLSDVNPELWKDVIALQKNWIGECSGMRLECRLEHDGIELPSPLSVFVSHPAAVFGASHLLLAPSHPLNQPPYQTQPDHQQTQVVPLSIKLIHPLTGDRLPVYVDHSRVFAEDQDMYLGIPSCIEADQQFAKDRDLQFRDVYQNDDSGITLKNSDQFSGLSVSEAVEAVSKYAQQLGCGGHMTSEKARDWLISRQRYWGTPIPVVHCKKYGAVPVSFEDLPVVLPELDNFRGSGTSPLENATEWMKAKCAKCDCDGYGLRETDTMDTFVDSSWYYLRYLDPHNKQAPFTRELANQHMPVDLYIGGKEHAIMHLYYARFVMHFLYDCGLVPSREPFTNLLTQGMVLGQSFKVKDTGKYISSEQVDFSGKKPVEKSTGAGLEVEWEKMSKSKYNGVDPQAVLATHGVDATRLCILSNVAPKSDRKWSEDVFVGVNRWQRRLWVLMYDYLQQKQHPAPMPSADVMKEAEELVRDSRNYFLKEVNFHVEKTFMLSVAISRLHGLTNALKKVPVTCLPHSLEFERALADCVIMVTPFAPLFASELWSGLQSCDHQLDIYKWDSSVLEQSWPKVDLDYHMSLKVKKNQKELLEVRLPMTIGNEATLTLRSALDLIQDLSEYQQIRPDIRGSHLDVVPGYKAELSLEVEDKKKKKKNKLKAVEN